jgi:hypothetical protein
MNEQMNKWMNPPRITSVGGNRVSQSKSDSDTGE